MFFAIGDRLVLQTSLSHKNLRKNNKNQMSTGNNNNNA